MIFACRLDCAKDDGGQSERFDATQGARQGCMLPPLLFNVLFAAALHVVLVRSIVRDVVQLKRC